MIMGKPVWAVVCGSIREQFEFNMTIAKLCDLRNQGLLDGIIISTWKGEIDKIPALRNTLNELKVSVIELNEKTVIEEKGVNMSFWIQEYQLRQGILHVPNDVFILKSRTEFGIDKILPFEPILRGSVSLEIDRNSEFSFKLRYRIAIMRFTLSSTFRFVDGGFVGYKSDILQMLPEQKNDLKYGLLEDIDPDVSFFIHIFLNKIPFFEEVQSICKRQFIFDIWSEKLVEYAKYSSEEDFSMPMIAIRFYAVYFLVMYYCFIKVDSFIYKRTDDHQAYTDLSIRQMFSGEASGTIKVIKRSCIGDPELIYCVISGKCVDSPFYRKLYGEITRLYQTDTLYDIHITYQDYKELYDYVLSELGMDSDYWLEWKPVSMESGVDYSYNDALKELYKNIEWNEDTWQELLEYSSSIMNKQSEKTFIKIHQYLDSMKNLPKEIQEDALGSALRSSLPADIAIAAKKLYFNEIEYYEEWISLLIRHFRDYIEVHVRSTPDSSNHLTGLFYYSLYESKKGNESFSKFVFELYKNKYGIGDQFLEDERYSNALFLQLQEIANSNYCNYMSDPSVKAIINFLIDEFPEKGLSYEVKQELLPIFIRRRMISPICQKKHKAIELVLKEAMAAENILEKCLWASELVKCIYVVQDLVINDISDYIMSLRAYLPEELLWKVYFSDNVEELLQHFIMFAEDINERDFVTLLQMICKKGHIRILKENLRELSGGNSLKKVALAMFANDDMRCDFPLFRIKRNRELWLNSQKIIKSGVDRKIIGVSDKEGRYWPYGEDFPSPSCVGICLEVLKNEVILTVNLAAVDNIYKDCLLNNLERIGIVVVNREESVICLMRKEFPVISFDEIDSQVTDILSALHEVEKTILNAIGQS